MGTTQSNSERTTMKGAIGMIAAEKCALSMVDYRPIAGGLGSIGLPDPPGC